ncbi:hypothetical protein Fmac_032779 [Flemingia macrophylla]|uniref:S5 DRBM domain-containing protein n=1 Tax=Flemingia macrophylla TaxID=520843 RepID=A0ABD1L6B5_9FABA
MPPDPDNDVYDFREMYVRYAQSDYGSYNGGQVVKYTAMVACGNYNGVIGFAKAKGPAVQLALRRYSQYLLEKFHNFIARSILWPCSDVQLHSLTENQILDIIQSMPHDAHPMGVLVNSISSLSIFHPDANPALRVSNKNCWQVTLVLDCLCIDHIIRNRIFVDEPDHAKMKSELDHLTIPNDGTDVWEIDPKHLKYGTQIASGSYGEL